MKKNCICLVAMLLATFSATSVYSQRKAGSENKITSSDLESNVSFLASHPMTGPNSVFVITDNQSKELLDIANEIDKKSPLNFDYSLSGRNHPLMLFSRSDHYNFVKKDIPILFFSTGLHTDYHTPGETIEKIDFKKMELITRTMYDIGLTVANKKTRIVVDNPYSSWGKSK